MNCCRETAKLGTRNTVQVFKLFDINRLPFSARFLLVYRLTVVCYRGGVVKGRTIKILTAIK
jgi:hypothetical protein